MTHTVGYSFTLAEGQDKLLSFDIQLVESSYNRVFLTYSSDPDEHFMGFGEQFTYFDMKGRYLPIFVTEQGIGRGLQPVTTVLNLLAGAGGNWATSYISVPHYVTSANHSFFLENNEYSAFDMRTSDRVQVHVLSGHMRGGILAGNSMTSLVSTYTRIIGRMGPLPDWIIEGAVIGLQGGTERVKARYERLKAQNVPIAALWLQDWVGQRRTIAGQQLWWNWVLDTQHYPDWSTFREMLEADHVKTLLYFNPHLVDTREKPQAVRNLYAEAVGNGYVVKGADAGPYLLKNTDFSAAMVDFTNPEAVSWLVRTLSEQVTATGAMGWMADFGEGLPYDAVLSSGESGITEHNLYPERWAGTNRTLVASMAAADQYVYFMRSGFRRSPRDVSLFWLGDQLVTWDAFDGLKTAIVGLLSSGLSGFSLNHSDTGGYTTITLPLLNYHRSPELLKRWTEMNAFTVVLRTHEGNQPANNTQIYDSDDQIAHFAQMAKIYAAWTFYRRQLVNEVATTGLPVVRPVCLHYPDDPAAYALRWEAFLVGNEFLVAPVTDPGRIEVEAYLPAGEWVHIWTGKRFVGSHARKVTIAAPIGSPAVFYRAESEVGLRFVKALRDQGLLSD